MILAFCVNVIISQAGPPMECKVLNDTKNVWVVECSGEVLNLPDYACLYANGMDKQTSADE